MKLIFKGDEFGKSIKQVRIIDEGLDMRAFAKKIKTSAATISRCENGKMPDLLTYAKLCSYVDKSMDDFFEIKFSNNKKTKV